MVSLLRRFRGLTYTNLFYSTGGKKASITAEGTVLFSGAGRRKQSIWCFCDGNRFFHIYRKENFEKSFLSGVKSDIINWFGTLDFSRGSGISETV
jgi:hypothetical protein